MAATKLVVGALAAPFLRLFLFLYALAFNFLVPAITTLASEFAVFDHWFSGVPGPTIPNRQFFHSATSHGSVEPDWNSIIAEGYPQKTIFNSLEEAGRYSIAIVVRTAGCVSWSVYYSDVPDVLMFERMRDPFFLDKYRELDEFYGDVNNGNLAAYSFINPAYFKFFDFEASDQHPPHDVIYGEFLLADIYDSLRNSRYWNESLLIVTYDEHGGFYDHVPPPQHDVPAPDNFRPPPSEPFFSFDRLGVRVPMIMASPYINKRTVVHAPPSSHYCHSSLSATLKEIHGLPSFLTKRDAWAATFSDIVDARPSPRTDCPKTLPRPGTMSQQRLWAIQSKTKLTLEEMNKLIETASPALGPISDLQREMLAISLGMNGVDTLDGLLDKAEMQTIATEQHGALFARRQMQTFRRKMQK